MDDQARFREGPHHGPGAAGMIEMNMRQEHIVHTGRGQLQGTQGVQYLGKRCVTGGVDNRHAPLFDDQMNRGQLRADIISVNSVNTVVVEQQIKHGRSRSRQGQGDRPATGV